MQEKLIGNNEKVGNLVMFAYCASISVAGWAAVMLLLNGGLRECIFTLGVPIAIIIKVLERKLGSMAKYIYACVPPVLGAITNAVCCTTDSDSYVCITHYYMAATLLLVIYLDIKLLKVNAIVTVVANAIMMIISPAGYFKLHKPIGWVFILLFYVILFLGCVFIAHRTNVLFATVEEKGGR